LRKVVKSQIWYYNHACGHSALDGSSSRHYEGTGLGLAAAYKMINILGGDIQVKSELGEGSTFTITIPISPEGLLNKLNEWLGK